MNIKVIVSQTIGICMAVIWSLVFINVFNSMVGLGVGVCFGISFGLCSDLILGKIGKKKSERSLNIKYERKKSGLQSASVGR